MGMALLKFLSVFEKLNVFMGNTTCFGFSAVGNAMATCGRWRARNPSELCCFVGMDEEAFQAYALLGHVNRRMARCGLAVQAVVGRVVVVTVQIGVLRSDRVMWRILYVRLHMHTVCSFTKLSGMNKILPAPGVCSTETANAVRSGCPNNMKSRTTWGKV